MLIFHGCNETKVVASVSNDVGQGEDFYLNYLINTL